MNIKKSFTKVAIIGGSGFYKFEGFNQSKELEISTPFGSPSDKIICGTYQDCEVYFLARHGRHHHLLPSEVNYRANIYAIKDLGVSWCIAINACGSLSEKFRPGEAVIPKQIIDRTTLRKNSFFGDGIVAHVSMADPFCPTLRDVLLQSSKKTSEQLVVHDTGTYVVIEGPNFSTRAESHWYRSMGAEIIGMTTMPEARLAREAQISYASVSVITDYDCWREDGHDVAPGDVIKSFRQTQSKVQALVTNALEILPNYSPSELVLNATKGAIMTHQDAIPNSTRERLAAILAGDKR